MADRSRYAIEFFSPANEAQGVTSLNYRISYNRFVVNDFTLEIEEHNLNLKGRLCQLESTDRINQTYKQELQ